MHVMGERSMDSCVTGIGAGIHACRGGSEQGFMHFGARIHHDSFRCVQIPHPYFTCKLRSKSSEIQRKKTLRGVLTFSGPDHVLENSKSACTSLKQRFTGTVHAV